MHKQSQNWPGVQFSTPLIVSSCFVKQTDMKLFWLETSNRVSLIIHNNNKPDLFKTSIQSIYFPVFTGVTQCSSRNVFGIGLDPYKLLTKTTFYKRGNKSKQNVSLERKKLKIQKWDL